MRPSCASTTLRTIARPRPEPCGLVVKNALKMRSRSSRGTPGPSSATSTITVRVCAVAAPGRACLLRAALRAPSDLHGALAFERLERVDQQVREQLTELMMVALDRRQPVVQLERAR